MKEASQYKITIDAPKEKVWSTLFDDATYRQWTAAFAEGSKAETDWQTGSKAYFVNETGDGMVSMIAESRPNEFMSIKHMGIIKNGQEDYDSAESKLWSSGLENYTLKPVSGGTELIIDLSIDYLPHEFKEYFAAAWPKALSKLKELAEQN